MTHEVNNEHQEDDKLLKLTSEKKKYLYVLKEAQKAKTPIRTQTEFQNLYESIFKTKAPQQSTVSEKFKEFNIEKTNSVYQYNKNVGDEIISHKYIVSTNCDDISELYSFPVGKIEDIGINDDINQKSSKTMYFFRIITQVGSENIVCNAISNWWGSQAYFSIIPCFGAVIVVCRSSKNAKKIHKVISQNITYESDSDNEE